MWFAEHGRHQLVLGTPVLWIPGSWWCFCYWPGWNLCSVSDTLTSAGACLVCPKKPKFQRADFLSWNNVLLLSICVPILSFWVQRGADVLTREPGRPRQCRGSGMSSSNQAPGVILAYNQNQSINLRGSLYVKQGESKLVFQAAFLKVTQKFLGETIKI